MPFPPRPTSAQDVFDQWVTHQNNPLANTRESINPNASTSYAFIWRSFCKWLMPANQHDQWQAAPWHTTTPEQILNFITTGITPANSTAPAKTSQRRYWSTINRILAFATSQQWITSNPAQQIHLNDRPPSEKSDGSILNPLQLQACYHHLPDPNTSHTHARDRAMLLLMLEHAITPQEIRNMCTMDLQRDPATGKYCAVHIPPQRSEHQSRTIPLSELASQALHKYIPQRTNFGSLQKAISELPKSGITSADRHPTTHVFLSVKQPTITMGTLRHITDQFITTACQAIHQDPPPRVGPQILRNTTIVKWLNEGIDPQTVANMAGLKNVKGLYHLRVHTSQAVRGQLNMANHHDHQNPKISLKPQT